MSTNPKPFEFNIAHSITLTDNEQGVCVADRENGRIQCFTVDGELVKIIQDRHRFGAQVYAVTYSPIAGTNCALFFTQPTWN